MNKKRNLLRRIVYLIVPMVSGLVVFLYSPEPKVLETYTRAVNQVAERIRLEGSLIEDLSYQCIANQDLNDSLWAYGRRANLYDVGLFNLSFTRHLESQSVAASLLEEAFFYDYDERRRNVLTMTEDFLRPEIEQVRSFLWDSVVTANGVFVWMDSTLLVHEKRFAVAGRLIKRLQTGEPIGVVALLVDTEVLRVLMTKAFESVHPKDTNVTAFIVSPSGGIIAGTNDFLDGHSISEAVGSSSYFETIIAQEQESGHLFVDFLGKRQKALYTRIRHNGPYLLAIYSDALDLRNISNYIYAFLALTITALFELIIHLQSGHIKTKNSQGPTFDGLSLSDLSSLSERERQLLSLLTRGLSNKEMASELGVKEQTVKNYLSSLYEKIGVHDRVSALLKLHERTGSGSSDVST